MSVVPSDIARRDRDRALIEAHCGGDATVFPVIVHDHYATLLAQAHRRLGSRPEAEDAVQETFERAYRGLCRLNGDYRIGAWLHRILVNVCHDHARRREVQRALPGRIGPRGIDTADAAEHASDPSVYRAVRAALDALPAAQRHTFWLHEMDGLSYPEVAAQLGISEANARARVHRARVALQRSLARTREAVAALVALPFGARIWSRAGRELAAPAVRDPVTGSAVVPAGPRSLGSLHAGMHHAAYVASSGPVAELAASGASGGMRPLLVLATGVATAFGGMLAAPAITRSSSPAEAPAVASASATGPAPTAAGLPDAEALVVIEPGDPARSGSVAVSVPTTGARDWVTAGAEAEYASSDAATDPADGSSPGAGDACPWLGQYPGILASVPGTAPVTGTLDRAESPAEPGAALTVVAGTVLRASDRPDGPIMTTVPVSLRAHVCLAHQQAAIVVDIEGPSGERAQLRGARVVRYSDAVSVFRGSIVVPADAPNVLPPWGLPGRFVARVEVDAARGIASVDIAFLGAPWSGPPADPPPTTVPPTAPPDPAPESDPPDPIDPADPADPGDPTPPTSAPAATPPSTGPGDAETEPGAP